MRAPVIILAHPSALERELIAELRQKYPQARIGQGWKGFIHRLAMLAHAERGTPVVLLEDGQSIPPRPYVRMLQRVALGLGTLDVRAGTCKSWYSYVAPALRHWPLASPARQAEQYGNTHRAPPGVTGQWPTDTLRPTLLVGEGYSKTGQKSSLPDWPFTSALSSGCSAWLAEQLETAGIAESELCWLNVKNRDGQSVPLDGLQNYPFRQVIALGKPASTALRRAGIPHQQTYHPQYWKRFHSTETYQLMRLIQGRTT